MPRRQVGSWMRTRAWKAIAYVIVAIVEPLLNLPCPRFDHSAHRMREM
jgi:hypothetical protein